MHKLFLKYEDEDYEIADNILEYTNRELKNELFECDRILDQDYTQEELDIFSVNNIDKFHISYFVSRLNSKISEILANSLESLVKYKLLEFCKKVYVIYEIDKKRYTSEEETKKVDSLKREIMDDMGIKNERFTQEIKRKELYKKLNIDLKSSESWMVSYKTNLIKINNNILDQLEKHELSFSEEEILKKDLSLKLCDYLDKNASNLFKKDKEKIEKYYLERGLSTDAKQNDNQLSKLEKRNQFRVDTRYILPFPTLKKDFVSKQILLCNILIRNRWMSD
ncbi:MAG: hypothetical protein ACXW0J_07120 [Nitrososphaeraceae archaeon]